VWFDNGVPSGDRWRHIIQRSLETCEVVLVVMTPEADASTWVDNEIDLARTLGKPFQNLLLDGEPFFGLRHLQHADVRGGRMPDQSFVDRLPKARNQAPPRPRTAVVSAVLVGHADGVTSVCWSPHGSLVATSGIDTTARIWDPASGQHLATITGH